MPSSKSQNNPYAQAAGAYGDHSQKHTPDQRELEARVLLKSAKMLQDLKDDWKNVDAELLDSTLRYNRQLWLIFYDTAVENPEEGRPDDLRSNIINLANFVFKRELEIIKDKDPEKLDILININKEIAAGLMTQKQNEDAAQASDTQQSVPEEKA